MSLCTNCHKEIPQGTRFCPHCGTKVLTTCLWCAADIDGSMKYCPKCGKQPSDLAPGLPMAIAQSWASAFASIKWNEHLLSPPQGIQWTANWAMPQWQREWLPSIGIPEPNTDPKEPWVFCTHINPQKEAGRPEGVGAQDIGAPHGRGISAGYLVATRCHIAAFPRFGSQREAPKNDRWHWVFHYKDLNHLHTHREKGRLVIEITASGPKTGGLGIILSATKFEVGDFFMLAAAIGSTDTAAKILTHAALGERMGQKREFQEVFESVVAKFFAEIAAVDI